MSESTADILRKAKGLIDTEEKWTKDPSGDVVFRGAPGPICVGLALSKACAETNEFDALVVYRGYTISRGYTGFVHFNDDENTTYADIIQSLDEVIAQQERVESEAAA